MDCLERWEALSARLSRRSASSQPSLVAAGCVRVTIRPACRYSALSRRIARSRSKPGQLASSCRLVVCRCRRVHRRGERAGQVQRRAGPHRAGCGRPPRPGSRAATRRARRAARAPRSAGRAARTRVLLADGGRAPSPGWPQQRRLDVQHAQVGQAHGQELRHRHRAMRQALAREDRQRQHAGVALQVDRQRAGRGACTRPSPRAARSGGRRCSKRSRSGISDGLSDDRRVRLPPSAPRPHLLEVATERAHAHQVRRPEGQCRLEHHGDCGIADSALSVLHARSAIRMTTASRAPRFQRFGAAPPARARSARPAWWRS